MPGEALRANLLILKCQQSEMKKGDSYGATFAFWNHTEEEKKIPKKRNSLLYKHKLFVVCLPTMCSPSQKQSLRILFSLKGKITIAFIVPVAHKDLLRSVWDKTVRQFRMKLVFQLVEVDLAEESSRPTWRVPVKSHRLKDVGGVTVGWCNNIDLMAWIRKVTVKKCIAVYLI